MPFIYRVLKAGIMKITSISYWKEDMQLTRPYAVTYIWHDHIQNIFIRIETDGGHFGIGAGSPSEMVTGELIDERCEDRIPQLQELLVGKDVREYRKLISILAGTFSSQPALLAALDMALLDVFCKSLDISIGKYLGSCLKPLPTSITIGIKNVSETVEEGLEYKERGFKIIKLKIGQSLEEDIERSLKLREAVGNDLLIRVDANQGYDVSSFQHYLNKTEKASLEFFEQPMKPADNEQMLQLPLDVRNICAADESLHKQKHALGLVKLGRPFGIFNIKLMKCGGISEAIRIAQIANSENIDLMWGCMDESVVSISASLNVALASPATKFLDLDGSFDLAKDIAKGGFELSEGKLIPLLERPGLGVELL